MFIKVTQSGGRRYAQLVESFRNDAGQPRQRTLATLGRLEPGGDVDRLIGALHKAQGREGSAAGGSIAIEDLQFLDARAAGDVWALSQLWSALDLDALPLAWSKSKAGPQVLACLKAMVFNRLCDPGSKLGVLRWLETVALPADFGFGEALPDHQQLLRSMDVLDAHAPAIAQRLAFLMRALVDKELSVVFYDLTTARVQGQAVVDGDVRQFGHSKQGGVARQFVLSLVQTAEGLPVAHEVHAGNTAEAATLMPMIRSLLERWPLKRVVLVADRGLLNLNNLKELDALQAELDATGRGVKLEYVLAVPAARYGEFRDEVLSLDARHDRNEAWFDELPWVHTDQDSAVEHTYRLVLAHDPQAAERRRQARRDEMNELIALGELWGGRLDTQDAGVRRRGRPLLDSGAKARLYHAVKDASLAHLIRVDLKSELFCFSVDEARLAYLEQLDGKLLVVTNTDAPAGQVIERYRSLADIERGFRVLKSDIEIGPVYHRLPRRIRAHALVCFLALILHRVLRRRLKASQRSESPTRLLEQLRRLQLQTVQIRQGPAINGLTALAPAQRDLFSAIGLTAPTPAQLGRGASTTDTATL